jgi:hypothetical protein
MFLNIFINRLKINIRDKQAIGWSLLFSLALGTLFYCAFESIYKNAVNTVVRTAVVLNAESNTFGDMGEILKTIQYDDGTKILNSAVAERMLVVCRTLRQLCSYNGYYARQGIAQIVYGIHHYGNAARQYAYCRLEACKQHICHNSNYTCPDYLRTAIHILLVVWLFSEKCAAKVRKIFNIADGKSDNAYNLLYQITFLK